MENSARKNPDIITYTASLASALHYSIFVACHYEDGLYFALDNSVPSDIIERCEIDMKIDISEEQRKNLNVTIKNCLDYDNYKNAEEATNAFKECHKASEALSKIYEANPPYHGNNHLLSLINLLHNRSNFNNHRPLLDQLR